MTTNVMPTATIPIGAARWKTSAMFTADAKPSTNSTEARMRTAVKTTIPRSAAHSSALAAADGPSGSACAAAVGGATAGDSVSWFMTR